jgi:hypothetical protein
VEAQSVEVIGRHDEKRIADVSRFGRNKAGDVQGTSGFDSEATDCRMALELGTSLR